jgi:hypothetical protein
MDNPVTPAKMDEDKQYIKQTQKAKNTINTVPTKYIQWRENRIGRNN